MDRRSASPSAAAHKRGNPPDDGGDADAEREVTKRPRKPGGHVKSGMLPAWIHSVGIGAFDPRGIGLPRQGQDAEHDRKQTERKPKRAAHMGDSFDADDESTSVC